MRWGLPRPDVQPHTMDHTKFQQPHSKDAKVAMACSAICKVWATLILGLACLLPPAGFAHGFAAAISLRKPLDQTWLLSGQCHRPPSSAFASSGAPGQSDHPGSSLVDVIPLGQPPSRSIMVGEPRTAALRAADASC